MKYKGLIFDLDGTAVISRADALPSQKLIEAVDSIKNKVIVSVATGRSYGDCRQILDLLKLKSPCIITAGTQIIESKNGMILWEKKISAESLKKTLAVCRRHNLQSSFSERIKKNPDGEYIIDQPVNAMYVDVDESIAGEIKDEINSIPDIVSHLASAWVPGKMTQHITHKDATKKNALEQWYKITGLKKEAVMGAGDNDNDLPLFENVGLRVAVGNATDALKKAADYIAPPVTEDGLVEVINKYFL